MESEAVRLILRQIKRKNLDWVGSSVVPFEISKTTDLERKGEMMAMLQIMGHLEKADSDDLKRAENIESLGFGSMDALHLAMAEKLAVDVFLTTDDKLIKKSVRLNTEIKVKVMNPVLWLQEVMI